jgi:hypothetical protein
VQDTDQNYQQKEATVKILFWRRRFYEACSTVLSTRRSLVFDGNLMTLYSHFVRHKHGYLRTFVSLDIDDGNFAALEFSTGAPADQELAWPKPSIPTS